MNFVGFLSPVKKYPLICGWEQMTLLLLVSATLIRSDQLFYLFIFNMNLFCYYFSMLSSSGVFMNQHLSSSFQPSTLDMKSTYPSQQSTHMYSKNTQPSSYPKVRPPTFSSLFQSNPRDTLVYILNLRLLFIRWRLQIT